MRTTFFRFDNFGMLRPVSECVETANLSLPGRKILEIYPDTKPGDVFSAVEIPGTRKGQSTVNIQRVCRLKTLK